MSSAGMDACRLPRRADCCVGCQPESCSQKGAELHQLYCAQLSIKVKTSIRIQGQLDALSEPVAQHGRQVVQHMEKRRLSDTSSHRRLIQSRPTHPQRVVRRDRTPITEAIARAAPAGGSAVSWQPPDRLPLRLLGQLLGWVQ